MNTGELTGNSNWQGDGRIVQLLYDLNPFSAIDFGVGRWGKFGFLFRKNFEDFSRIVLNQTDPRSLHGVEGHAPNFWHLLRFCPYYNLLLQEKIEDRVEKIQYEEYELGFFGDVLEHFPREQAIHLVKTCVAKKMKLIVQMPLGNYPQEVPGNSLETHKSTWEYEDLAVFGPRGVSIYYDILGRPFVVFSVI